MVSINHHLVSRVTCLRKKPWFMYSNVIPAIPFYIIALASFWKVEKIGAIIILCSVAVIHLLTFLVCIWSFRYRIHVRYSVVSSLEEADSVYVLAAPNCGNSAICDLHRRLSKDAVIYWFDFQKLRFISSGNGRDTEFNLLDFPDNEELETYRNVRGHTHESLAEAKEKWGENDLCMEIPSFMELFYEHATAPFFVFQVFSVLLWCVDDYVGYTLFTLAMLILMESMQVKQQIQSMKSLRAMRTESFPVLVYRNRQWQTVSSSQLVPGDLISISSHPYRPSSWDVEAEDAVAPCDCLLLTGTCVVNEAVLTGESVPKSKSGILPTLTNETRHVRLSISEERNVHRRHMVYGGTKIILHKAGFAESSLSDVSAPVNHGCLAYVIRTGFYTSQGDMLRNMMYSSTRASANNKESFIFIFILLIFAILSALYVYRVGSQDARRNHWKLILHCIMIITNVVPPELPLELSYAVNNSLMSLFGKGIFCTEPFRIPYAGRVKTCYFDKTGTLTSDKLELLGVATCEKPDEGVVHPDNLIPPDATSVMATCQELVWVNGKLLGNQMELTALSHSGWDFSADGRVSPPRWLRSKGVKSLVPVFRFNFESVNRRMSVVCKVENSRALKVFMKGAPEVVEEWLAEVPANYTSVYKHYMLQGKRVLAMAWKNLPESVSVADLKNKPRAFIESNLHFCGFLLFDCPLKTTTESTVQSLLDSRFLVKIITGDNPYTACAVARQCGIIDPSQNVLVLARSETEGLYWEDIMTQSLYEPFDSNESTLKALQQQFVLVVNGSLLLNQPDYLFAVTPYVTVFARMSPQQKGDVIRATKERGIYCLMCGDGTNDVAALKQSHVGVSIMSNVEIEDYIAKRETKMNELENKSMDELTNEQFDSFVSQMKSPALQNTYRTIGGRRVPMRSVHPQQKQAKKDPGESLEEWSDRLMQEASQNVQLKLGDASIASPFTCKSTGIDKVLQILRFGRCTLVTTFQIYIILALNSLISAYSMSVLYIDGVKSGDFQMTISGFLIAAIFFMISSSKPLETLSREHPPTKLFSGYILATIAAQFAVHFVTMYIVRKMVLPFVITGAEDYLPDSDFKPNVLNTVVFLLDLIMQLFVFIVNYEGHPFMQSIKENKLLYYTFIGSFVFFMVLTLEIIPPLNNWMQLVPFPSTEFKVKFLLLSLVDGLLAFILDRFLKWLDRIINKNN